MKRADWVDGSNYVACWAYCCLYRRLHQTLSL